MNDDLNFERDVYIDPNALDVELLDHANLFCRYGEAAAHAEAVAKRAAEKKKSTSARLTMDSQRNPNIMGDGIKPTQANVDAWVRDHSDYQAVVDEMIEAEHDYARLKIAVDAFGFQRRTMLENLVRLCLGEYFAGPKLPRDLSKQWLESGRDRRVVERQKTRKKGRAAK